MTCAALRAGEETFFSPSSDRDLLLFLSGGILFDPSPLLFGGLDPIEGLVIGRGRDQKKSEGAVMNSFGSHELCFPLTEHPCVTERV